VHAGAGLARSLKTSLHCETVVRGMAVVAGELYVLRVGASGCCSAAADVAVYETRLWTLERRLSVPGLRAACDLAASPPPTAPRLYIADRGADLVHKVTRHCCNNDDT